jgi:hypothetical protein
MDARDVGKFFKAHLLERWRGNKRSTVYKGTAYTAEATAANLQTWYSDKPSKLIGAPCFHFEWRIKSAAAVVRAKLDDFAKIRSLNFWEFWLRRLRLARLPTSRTELESLGRAFHGQPKRKKPRIEYWGPIEMNLDLRTGGFLTRRHQSVGDFMQVHGRKFRRHARLLPIDWLLPQNQHHLL